MRSVSDFQQVFLYRHFVDFRKSINGLGAIVQEEMQLDLFLPVLFVFCCKRRKRIKILYWDKTGFAIWYKKLEVDLFSWPKNETEQTIGISSQELAWLLEGVDLSAIKPHEEKKYKKIC